MRPGMEWDALNRTWKPVDYINMTVDQLRERRDQADDRLAEVKAQAEAIYPVAVSQALLNKSAEQLQELIIDLAKEVPGLIIGLV